MIGMEKEAFITRVLNSDKPLSLREKLGVVSKLSLPSILAQISEIIMQYIDAAMVGVLGASASASIGLVASSTWLMGGLIMSCGTGFAVQVAHQIGARNNTRAREIFRQGIVTSLLISILLALVGYWVALRLPQWLGADASIWKDAIAYLTVYCIFIPVRMMNMLHFSMLQCSGNMKTPSILSAISCALDVVFNFFLIFPTRTMQLFGIAMRVPGAGLGVTGAQLGTSLSILVSMIFMIYYAAIKSPQLSLQREKGSWIPEGSVLKEATMIGLPMAFENSALCLAQIISTKIVAPLGTIAIAANSFAVTAESICYMPGYGISGAATTLVGQSVGAKRKDMAKSFAWLATFTGMAIMTLMAVIMYFICPAVFAFLTPDLDVQRLGVEILRIELWAEPMFAASIVATGAMRGAGDTFIPGVLNLVSIWGVRIVMSLLLVKQFGLVGVWVAMCVELNVRGILFLIRLKREKWLERALV